MKDGKKGTKAKKAKDEPGAAPAPKDDMPAPSEGPAWKRMGKAIAMALAIDLAFAATLFVPVVGFVLFLMVGPYSGAFIGGKWLNRANKGEWLWSTFWVVIIWSSALVALIIGLMQTLGSFGLVIDIYGGIMIGLIYLFPLIFTLTGFYHGALIIEGDDEEHVEGGLKEKTTQKENDHEPKKRSARPIIRS